MNKFFLSQFNWRTHSPLYAITNCALIILASSRLSFALFCTGALLWVYIMTKAVYLLIRNILPKKGRYILLVFISGFIASLYLLLAELINPVLMLNCWLFVILIPPGLTTSKQFRMTDETEAVESMIRVFLEAAGLGVVIIIISLIREPLGFGTLSIPGGRGGIIELFNSNGDSINSVRILSASAGGLLLLGYAAALFRYFRAAKSYQEEEE